MEIKDVNSEEIKTAIVKLKKAMSKKMVGDGAKKLATEAIKAMKKIPAVGKRSKWFLGYFPPLIDSKVPASLLHKCIYEMAAGEFARPAPLGEPQGDWWDGFFHDLSDRNKEEHKFRCEFADLIGC